MTTALLYTAGALSFIIAIVISIGLHEAGHMLFAKKFGAKVPEFFIGFGPKIWSFKRGETEYGLKAIPLGGYVKIMGMMPPSKDQIIQRDPETGERRLKKTDTGMFSQLIHTARKVEYDVIKDEDEERLFYRIVWWKKWIVMAAGPVTNLILAFLIFQILFATHGLREWKVPDGHPTVQALPKCLIPLNSTRTECKPSDPVAPALRDGVKVGDKIVSFNGKEIDKWDSLRRSIQNNGVGPATLVVDRKGKLIEIKTETILGYFYDIDDPKKLVKAPGMGVRAKGELVTEKGGPIFVSKYLYGQGKEILQALPTIPKKVWNVALAIVGVEERAQDSPVSLVGGSRFAGEVAAMDEKRIPTTSKIVLLTTLVASMNMFLAVLNALPIFPFDGGHMMTAAWEGAKRRIWKILKRKDIPHVDLAKGLPLTYILGSIVFLMSFILIIGDIVTPVKIF
jgi:membrane-associated protease RseP (regulator of RpoE activity)